ncbi:MAG TPA: hypothetical protein VHZ24_06570 [Pirellulales bacterium]|jgi:hypothetical protein|nr:hypothetical protein [Pirellulales bacterium]
MAADPASTAEPLYTLEHEFSIPFSVETSSDSTDKAAQALLFVSADQGKTWNLCDTQAASDGSFNFRAPFDGEFCFVVRVGNPERAPPPAAMTEPELRVVIGPGRAPQRVCAELRGAIDPAVADARSVNSRLFAIEYAEPESTETVRSVEMWWTGNGGTSWQRYGCDEDRRSPMHVSVDGDGVYGLWLVVHDSAAPEEPLPQAGDVPQAWVAVDTVAPEARLTAAEIGANRQEDELVLHWSAADGQLAADPISLAIAGAPEGPWTDLGKVSGNIGKYHCPIRTIEASLHAMPLYFKLSAADAAGNVTTFVTSEPVVLPEEVVLAASRHTAGATVYGTRWYQQFR